MALPLARARSAASRHSALAEGAALGARRLNRRLARRALARRDPAPGRTANGPRAQPRRPTGLGTGCRGRSHSRTLGWDGFILIFL